MTLIVEFKGLTEAQINQAIADKLEWPIRELLDEHGQLDWQGMQYFLELKKDMRIVMDALMIVIRRLEAQGIIERIQGGLPTLCRLKDGKTREVLVPVPLTYVEGYYELYARYQAIRQNPELATLPELLIDDLYLPRRLPTPKTYL